MSEADLLRMKEGLLEEVKKQDDLRKEVLKSLKLNHWSSDFFQHPAVLLIIGFCLTSLVGTFLASVWQEKDKRKQDARLLKELNLKSKTELMDRTSALILQTYSASSDMIALFQRGGMPDIRQKILLERMDYWQGISRQWRETYPILERRITGQFRDPKIKANFQEVVNLRGGIGLEIPDWRSEIYYGGWDLIGEKCNEKTCAPKCQRKDCQPLNCDHPEKEKYFFNRVRCTNLHNEDMKDRALAVLDAMMAEIKADEQDDSTEPSSAWLRLKRWFI